jgi:hypothetical protein
MRLSETAPLWNLVRQFTFMLEILIASLVVLLMASLTMNGYLFGKMQKPVEAAKAPEIKLEPAAFAGVPRAPRNEDQNQQPGIARKIVSPSEAIARARQEKDGLVTTKVPPAIKNGFLKDAEAVVASSAT